MHLSAGRFFSVERVLTYMIEINGRDGGGAVVRVAVGLAAATQQPVRVTNIREKRPKPGLRPQHLAGVNAVATLCDAELVGAENGSTTLTFVPNAFKTHQKIRVKIDTAGSIALALQPLQIAMLSTGKNVDVVVDGGATAGKWAPPIPYVQHVANPVMNVFGVEQSLDVRRHGFYPAGGALVHATLGPSTLQSRALLDRDDIVEVHGISLASQHLKEAEVAERQRKVARHMVANEYPSIDMDIAVKYVPSRSPGSCIVLWGVTEDGLVVGADAIGEKGVRAELVGQEAGQILVDQIRRGAPVDDWVADQLIPVLAVAGGELRVPRFTSHVKHNIAVAQQIVDAEWTVDEADGIVAVQ